MKVEDFLGSGWKYPVSIKKGKIVSSGGEDSIRESIIIILTTPKGERVMRPDFGCEINELVFAQNTTSTATLIEFYIKEALLKWEPRIEVLDVSATPDEDERDKIDINIEYMVKTTNTRDNLVYPFYLDKGGV
jgi:phage baseplate assembly protein W